MNYFRNMEIKQEAVHEIFTAYKNITRPLHVIFASSMISMTHTKK